MGLTLAFAALVLAVLAVAGALVLGWADRVLAVETDPRVAAIEAALPGSNCAGCGYLGCADYAAAVAAGRAPPTLCGPGGAASAAGVARVMGIDPGEHMPYRPVVHCAADRQARLLLADYRGEQTCAAANLVAGVQGCAFGCLGLGDCERACPHAAIGVVDGLARVDYTRCVGCRRCEKVCPRRIITMVPFKSERVLVVACSNTDSAAEVRRVCRVGCVGCRSCAKLSNGLIRMSGNVPGIDYDAYDPAADLSALVEKCPRESLIYVGNPTEADKAAVADEHIDGPVKPKFETTVDRTEWRG